MIRRLVRDQTRAEEDGFRLRGMDMTRLETFTDAAFAFAATMLALNPDQIPTTFDDLVNSLRGVPALVASLFILMIFWRAHERFSRRYGIEDGMTMFLSFSMIAVVLVFVYPLKFMFLQCFGWMHPVFRSPEWASAIQTSGQLSDLFVIYGIGWILFQCVTLLMFLHAWRRREQLELDELERHDTMTDIHVVLVYIGVAVVSIMLSIMFAGSMWVISAGIIYCSYGALMPLLHIVREPGRKRAKAVAVSKR